MTISEKEFQQEIIKLARLCGWRCHHHYDSRRSEPGWPDLVCVHETDYWRLPTVMLEVKAERGRVSQAQEWWLERLDKGHVLQDYLVVRLVRPSDWPWIEALLTGRDEWRQAS